MAYLGLLPNSVAVITGGAAGIGFAAAMEFARQGLRVCIADIGENRLSSAAAVLAKAAPEGAASIMTAATDVSQAEQVRKLAAAVRERFGGADI